MVKLLIYTYIMIGILIIIKEFGIIEDLNENYKNYNKSKYFHKSLNDFNEMIKNYEGWEKYYETYSNNTKYIYYKSQINNEYNFVEFIINNKNNSHYYSYSNSIFMNMCCSDNNGCYSCDNNYSINKNNIMKIMTDINYNNEGIDQTSYGRHIITNLNNYSYELEKNKISRMIKHGLLNNIIEYINSYYNILTIENHYFIEKVFIECF